MDNAAVLSIGFIKAALYDYKDKPALDGADWQELYSFAQKHSISSIVYSGIKKMKIDIPENIFNAFEQMKNIDMARDIAQSCEVEYILGEFEAAGVDAMPLKGHYMRLFYPETYLRTRCDSDILIKPELTDAALSVMEDQAFPIREESEHEIVFKRPPMISIEIHKLLLKRSTSETLYQYYKNIWEKAVNETGKQHIYKMTNEDFYIYMLVHLAKHYKNGGTGIRSILDIYIFNRHFKNNIDVEYITQELKKIGLYEFNKKVKELSLYWFEGEECSKEVLFMSDFITGSTTYGNIELASAAKVINISEGNIVRAKIKRFFEVVVPKYTNMTFLYPSLRGKPFLLPFYWIWRGIDRVLLKKKSIRTIHLNAEAERVESLKKHFYDIGLNL